MAKIDTVKDLPTWFDLNNYNATNEFLAKDWLFHIGLRATLSSMVHTLKFDHSAALPELKKLRESGSTEAMYILDALEALNHIRAQPIACHLPENFYWDAAHSCVSNESLALHRPIRPLTLHDMLCQKMGDQFAVEDGEADSSTLTLWNYLKDEDLYAYPEDEINSEQDKEIQAQSLTTLISQEDEDDLSQRIPHIEINIDRKIEGKWINPAVTVDLNSPDAAILKSFKEWLKRERAKQPKEASTPKKPAFDWWSNYGLLPYLDLSLWSQETGNHIPDRVMASAISYDKFGEDRLRKTIKPIASNLSALLDSLKPFAAEDSHQIQYPEKIHSR